MQTGAKLKTAIDAFNKANARAADLQREVWRLAELVYQLQSELAALKAGQTEVKIWTN